MRTARWGSVVGPLLLATVGALLWALCFQGEEGGRWLPWFALAPLIPALVHRRGVAFAYLHGVLFWLASIPWIAPTLSHFGGLPAPVSGLLLVLLAGYLGLYGALWGAVARRWLLSGRDGWALLLLPALWVLMEVIRGWLFTGFPWNLAAYAWIDVPGALGLASWVGPWGVSFLIVFANLGLGIAALRRRWEPAASALLVAFLALALGARWAAPEGEGAGASRPVRVIQPDSGILDGSDLEAALEAYRTLLRMSWDACDRPGALLVWPESAAFPFSLERDPRLAEDLDALATAGCPVLLNSARRDDGRVFNTAYLVTEGGGRESYDKTHLVPWGEYVPLADLLPFVETLAREAGSFSPGEVRRLLSWGPDRIGVAICFEIVFPGEVAARVREGATILATLTNDAWYGDSSAPRQHLRAARFRAAETRRPVLRAALTGISVVVAPDGAVRERAGVGEVAVLASTVRGRTELTPYVRAPWLVPLLCGLLGLSAIILAPRRAP